MKKSLLALIVLTTISLVLTAQPAAARITDQPPPQPGWTHSPAYARDTAQRHGIVLQGSKIEFGSPVIAEIDGDTGNGKEVAIGGNDGRAYVYRANGSLLWTKLLPIAGCSGQALVNSKPTVGALYGDGTPYVLFSYGAISNTNRACDGGVIAYRGSDGQQAWNFSQKAYDPQTPEGSVPNTNLEELYGVVSAPALADADGDGKLEVAFGGFDRNAYLLNFDGSVRWYYHAADTVWSTPLFMNIDDDPQLELIVATDISANPNIVPPTQDGGFLQAFETAPRSPARIPFQTGFIWRTAFDQVLFSSPISADVLASNSGAEIVTGSGCFFPQGSTNRRGRWVKIINPRNGAVIQTLNAPACMESSPAVGDIDNDGQLEIVATINGATAIGGDGFGRIVAWDPTNPTPKWSVIPRDPNSGSNDGFGGKLQSPVIADLDGNGSLEVIASNFWSVHVLNGATGAPLTCQNPNCGSQTALFAWLTLKGTPAVGDLDNDGDLELVIGGSHLDNTSKGHLYAWTNFAGTLGSPTTSQQPYAAPWPQLRRDALASGTYAEPGIVPSAPTVGTLVQQGDQTEFAIEIGSGDGSAFTWSASKSGDSNGILQLLSTTGGTQDKLRIRLSAGALAAGSYTATINLSAPDLPDVAIPITLRVVSGTVRNDYLPMTRR